MATAWDRRADRVAGDALDVKAIEQRRVLGRDAPAGKLGGELTKEHRGQARAALAGGATRVGDQEAFARGLAGEREHELLLATEARGIRAPDGGAEVARRLAGKW